MSPIGRVFIVLNLLLSGAFLWFSGVYLQSATDWKSRFDARDSEFNTSQSQWNAEKDTLTSDINRVQSNLQGETARANRLENDVKEKNDEIQRQEALLANVQAQLQKLETSYSTVAGAIENAVAEAKDARQDWSKADQEKTAALREKEVAEASLGQAQQKIQALEGQLAETKGQVAQLERSVKEKDVLISIANTRYPGVFQGAQPPLEGRVAEVSSTGDMLTIDITNNPEKAEIKRGYSLAIYEGSNYKGDAIITDVHENYVFARMTKVRTPVQRGDSASTGM